MTLVSPSQSNSGETIEASDINTPVNQLAAVINGNIDSTNIADNSIGTTKLAASSVNSTKISFGGSGAGIWWEEIGRVTLASAGNALSLTTLPARKYLRVMITNIQTATTAENITFNGDTTATYAWRRSVNNATDATFAPANNLDFLGDNAQVGTLFIDITNSATRQKFVHGYRDATSAAGASIPNRVELVGIWSNTSAQITRIDYTTATSTFAIGSEMIVLGHD